MNLQLTKEDLRSVELDQNNIQKWFTELEDFMKAKNLKSQKLKMKALKDNLPEEVKNESWCQEILESKKLQVTPKPYKVLKDDIIQQYSPMKPLEAFMIVVFGVLLPTVDIGTDYFLSLRLFLAFWAGRKSSWPQRNILEKFPIFWERIFFKWSNTFV